MKHKMNIVSFQTQKNLEEGADNNKVPFFLGLPGDEWTSGMKTH